MAGDFAADRSTAAGGPLGSAVPARVGANVFGPQLFQHYPIGDTATRRPVIIAFEADDLSWVVQDFVQRGYVVVTPEVRCRPSTPDLDNLLRTRQGMVDGAAAVRFLRANADR